MNNHIGSKFDAFLKEENLLEKTTKAAVKKVAIFKIEEVMKKQKIDKSVSNTK